MERNLYVYRYVDHPFDEVVRTLTDEPAAILQGATEAARQRVHTLGARIRVGVGGFEVGRTVVVDIGDPSPLGAHCVTFPVSWQAEEHAALFPALRGQIEVAAVSNHPPITQVSFIGHYRPPLGILGAAADASVGHRLADAAIQHFVEDIAAQLDAHLARAHGAVTLLD